MKKKWKRRKTTFTNLEKKLEYKLTAERINYYLEKISKVIIFTFFYKIKLYRIR